MKINDLKYGVLRKLGYVFLGSIVGGLCKTLRVKIINEKIIDELDKCNKHFIVSFWHGTMLYPWYLNRNKKMMGLTSYSKDGELLARALKRWDYVVVRGSSSKGGNVALGIIVDFAKHEGSVAMTPDGPRGPVHKFKAGAVVAAKRSSVPLVLLGVAYQKKQFLRSWDRFQIPLPFSRVRLIYSDPIYVKADAGKDEVSGLITECEEQLIDLQSKAEDFSN